MIALPGVETGRDIEKKRGWNVAWLWAWLCRQAVEKDALKLFEFGTIGFSETGWIVADAAPDGRNGPIAIRLADSRSKRMEERISLTFSKGMLLRLLINGTAGEHASGEGFSGFDCTLVRVGIEGDVFRVGAAS